MTSYLQEYGLTFLERNPKIKESRIIGFLPPELTDIPDYMENETVRIGVLQHIYSLLQLPPENYYNKTVKKTNDEGFEMGWHMDDISILRHSKKHSTDELTNCFYKLNDKYTLYARDDLPVYSCVIYCSDYNKDFTGGTFEFADGFIVYPEKNKFVIFDSREVHKVNKIKSGIRENYLIKIYPK